MEGAAVAGYEGKDPALLLLIVKDRQRIQKHHILREKICLEMLEQSMDVFHESCDGQVVKLTARIVARHGLETREPIFKGYLRWIVCIWTKREWQCVRDTLKLTVKGKEGS